MHRCFQQKPRRIDSLEDLRVDGKCIKMYLKDVKRAGSGVDSADSRKGIETSSPGL
jgi:hypothetical protein